MSENSAVNYSKYPQIIRPSNDNNYEYYFTRAWPYGPEASVVAELLDSADIYSLHQLISFYQGDLLDSKHIRIFVAFILNLTIAETVKLDVIAMLLEQCTDSFLIAILELVAVRPIADTHLLLTVIATNLNLIFDDLDNIDYLEEVFHTLCSPVFYFPDNSQEMSEELAYRRIEFITPELLVHLLLNLREIGWGTVSIEVNLLQHREDLLNKLPNDYLSSLLLDTPPKLLDSLCSLMQEYVPDLKGKPAEI